MQQNCVTKFSVCAVWNAVGHTFWSPSNEWIPHDWPMHQVAPSTPIASCYSVLISPLRCHALELNLANTVLWSNLLPNSSPVQCSSPTKMAEINLNGERVKKGSRVWKGIPIKNLDECPGARAYAYAQVTTKGGGIIPKSRCDMVCPGRMGIGIFCAWACVWMEFCLDVCL